MTRSARLLPMFVVAAMVVLFGSALGRNPRVLPSVLLDKSAPAFRLPDLHDGSLQLSAANLTGGVTLLNVWASWCVQCRTEHDLLKLLATEPGLRLFGLNYKDRPEDGRRWLDFYGNPFFAVAADTDGRVGMDYGVYGVPETFVIDASGVIRWRHVGPLDQHIWRDELLPVVRRLLKDST